MFDIKDKKSIHSISNFIFYTAVLQYHKANLDTDSCVDS